MTRWRKAIFQCDRPKCGAIHERIDREGQTFLPEGWTETGAYTQDEKHYCPRHRVVVTILDAVGEKGGWTEEK